VTVGQLSRQCILAAGLLLALPALADETGPLAVVPKPRAEANPEFGCVRPEEDMRKHHMDYLMVHRDDTLRRGIRTRDFSLAECVNCHITPKPDGQYARFGEKEHFCSSCHTYAAVRIDCFECHRDTPDPEKVRETAQQNPHRGLAADSNHPAGIMPVSATVGEAR